MLTADRRWPPVPTPTAPSASPTGRSPTRPIPGSPARRRSPTRCATTARPAAQPDPLCTTTGHGDGQPRRPQPAAGRRPGDDRDGRGHPDPGDADGQRSRRRSADVRHRCSRQRHAVRHGARSRLHPAGGLLRRPDTFTFTVVRRPGHVRPGDRRRSRSARSTTRRRPAPTACRRRDTDRRAISAASLLANDTPGPSNEATQTLAVTDADAGPDTHGTVALARGTITYIPDPAFAGPASFTYTVCDNGTTAGAARPAVRRRRGDAGRWPRPPTRRRSASRRRSTPSRTRRCRSRSSATTPTAIRWRSPWPRRRRTGRCRAPPRTSPTPRHPTTSGRTSCSFTVFDGQATSVPVDGVDHGQRGQRSAERRRRRRHGDRRPAVRRWIRRRCWPTTSPGRPNEAGQALAVTAVAAGADTHGTVTLADGTITYTPDAGFAGTATFTYTVCDDGTTDAAARSALRDRPAR